MTYWILELFGLFFCKPKFITDFWDALQEKCVYLSFLNILHVCHQGYLSNTLSFTNLHNGSWMQLCYTISSTSESIKANCFQPCFTPPVAESVDPHISLALGKTQSSLMTVPWTLHKASLQQGRRFCSTSCPWQRSSAHQLQLIHCKLTGNEEPLNEFQRDGRADPQ